jgi:protein LTV1
MVLAETSGGNTREESEPAGSSRASQYSAATGRSKIKSRRDLEGEFQENVRKNEGEAAIHGVYYDDTEYDYMQHMRDLGSGGGEAYFVEAPAEKKKGKQKMDLADALRNTSLQDRQSDAGLSMNSNVSSVSDVFGEDMAASEFVRKNTYQDQQNIPDAIAGFQPDMDPRLREVLEALEDDAYVDDEDDIFGELAKDGYEVDQLEWDDSLDVDDRDAMDRFLDEEDDGWESDATIKASSPAPAVKSNPMDPASLPAPDEAPAATQEGDLAYLDEFKKFKNDVKSAKPSRPAAPSAMESSVISALTSGGRKKKRKGALTGTSGYSMSSSALHRTEGLTLLDQRFDKIEEEYADDGFGDFPDDESMVSGMSKMSGISKMSGMSMMSGASMWSGSEAPPLRSDFDSIMDDFLVNHHVQGKMRVKKGKQQSGLEQLEEVRKGLGAARVSARVKAQQKA